MRLNYVTLLRSGYTMKQAKKMLKQTFGGVKRVRTIEKLKRETEFDKST